jgi:hypothetical protein
MTGPAVILQAQLASLELDESQPVIYDRPIGLRLLYQDPISAAEHYLVRYPADLETRFRLARNRTPKSADWEL